MFRKMVGLAFLMAGLASIAASSVCGSRASVAGVAGLRSPLALQARLMQLPRSHKEEQKARHTSNARAVDPSKDSEELAAMQAKAVQAWEADKLAKREARSTNSEGRSPIGFLSPPKSLGHIGKVAGQDHRVGSGRQSGNRGGG